jgi:hypothetical protein
VQSVAFGSAFCGSSMGNETKRSRSQIRLFDYLAVGIRNGRSIGSSMQDLQFNFPNSSLLSRVVDTSAVFFFLQRPHALVCE